MKNTIGIIALLLVSQSILAEEVKTNNAVENQSETKSIESDTATVKPTSAASTTSTTKASMNEKSGFSRGSVVRSAFTTKITDREPTENLKNLTNEKSQVKFFTELRDMSGQTAVHRWEYKGKVVAEVKFNVKGPRWRVWSSKSLAPKLTGDWKVSVVNGAGEIISEKSFSYDVAPVSEAAPTPDTSVPPTTAPAAAPESMQ